MKLHLPSKLRSALLSSFAVLAATTLASGSQALAEGADALYQRPDMTGPEFVWTGGAGDNNLLTAGNWANNTAPTEKGNHLIFDHIADPLVTTGAPGNTGAPGGGVSVTGNSNVTVSLGQYGGPVYVEEGSVLSATYGVQFKNNMSGSTNANVYVEGTLNLTSPNGTMILDPNENHYWHIGPTGMINLVDTTGVTKNEKTWNVEVVVPTPVAPDTSGLTNRVATDDALVKRKFISSGADLSGALDSLTVWLLNEDGTYTSLTAIDSWTGAGDGSYMLLATPGGMYIQYKGQGIAQETLVWNSTDGTWSNQGTGWYKQGDGEKTDTSFVEDDSVVFTGEGNATITLTGTILADTVTFEAGTQYTLNMGEDDSLTAQTLTLGENAALTLGDDATVMLNGSATLGSGATLTLGNASLSAATLTLGDNARIIVADGKTAAINAAITMGTGNQIELGDASSLTLGNSVNRMESFTGVVLGGTDAMLSVWLKGAGNNDFGMVTLSPGSTIKDLTVFGVYGANISGQAAGDTLNGATLHIGNGTTFIIRNGAGTIAPSERIVVEGDMAVNMNHQASETPVIASDIVGGAGVTASNTIRFFRTGANVTLKLTGDIDYAGSFLMDNSSGGFSPVVTFADSTVNLGTLNVNYCLGEFHFNNVQATIGTVSSTCNWAGHYGIFFNQGTTASITTATAGRNGNITINNGARVDAANVRTNGSGTIYVNAGGILNVTGANNAHGPNPSFIIDSGGTLSLNGGTINSASAILNLGYAGVGTMNAQSGTANLVGLNFWAQGNGVFRGKLLLGSATSGTARVNLGATGIENFADGAVIELGMGTLGATANWSLAYNPAFTPAYVKLVAAEGSYIDTLDANDHATGRTVTFQTGLTGSGKITKIGAGTLVLNGAAKGETKDDDGNVTDAGFTGTVELKEGNLSIKDSSVIGNGTLLIGAGRTVAVTADDRNYALNAGSTLGTTAYTGTTATLSGNLQLNGGALYFESLGTGAAALTATAISVADGAATSVTLNSSSLDTAATYLVLAGTGLTEANLASFTLSGLSAQFYTAQFALNADNVLTLQLVERTDIKTWVSGTWNTNAENHAWVISDTPSGFNEGDTVYFTNSATDKNVTIDGTVTPGSVFVSGTGFVFSGTGSIAGTGSLTLGENASLTLANTNSYEGGTVLKSGSSLTVTGAGALGSGKVAMEGTSILELQIGTWNLSNKLTADSRGTVRLRGTSSASIAGSGRGLTIDVGSGKTLNMNAGAYAGTIMGAGSIKANNTGTLSISGTIDMAGDYSGIAGNGSSHTLTLESGASMKVKDFYGRFEHNGSSVINIMGNALLNVTGTLQVVRDGQAEMNIAEGGTVIAQTLEMAGNWENATNKKATINLNGGTLMIGAGGIVKKNNNAYALNMASGTLGTTSATGWATALDMVLGGGTGGELTIDTRQFNADSKTYNDQASTKITINGVLSGDGALKKTGSGTLELGGINTYTGKTTVEAGTLSYTNAGACTMHSIAMGAGARMTSASTAITLASGSTLEFDMTGAIANGNTGAVPFITWGAAALTLADTSHSVTLSGLDGLDAGEYTLAAWGSLATPGNVFTLTNPVTSADGFFTYELVYNDDRTALVLRITDNRISSGFLWNGGSGARKWINDDITGWEARGSASGTTLAGQAVIFSATEAGEVVISGDVSPKSIVFTGGTYTLTSDPANEGRIVDMDAGNKTTLSISGTGTDVTINIANEYTGGTTISGGKLTIGAVDALGTVGDITMDGGTLAYADSALGTDVTGYDISGRIKLGANGKGKLNIEVAGADDTVTWAALAADIMNTADTTFTKTGAGTLALANIGTSLAHLTVSGGTLDFTTNVTIGEASDNATIIQVADGARLRFSTGAVNLYGQLNGTGTITIGGAGTTGTVNISNTGNANFKGRLELLGNGTDMNTSANWVAFGTASSMGEGSVLIDGKGFHIAAAGNATADIEIGATHGTWQNGSSGQTYTFSGSISGSGMWMMSDNVRFQNNLLGDLTGFSGTLATSESTASDQSQSWNFGDGHAYAGAGNSIFGDGAILAGNQSEATDPSLFGNYVVNYNNALLYLNALVAGKSNLTHAGTGTLVLDEANTSTGDLAITQEGATVQLGTEDTAAEWAGSTLSGAGTFRIVNGTLKKAMTRTEGSTARIAVDAGIDADIDLGGTDGSLLGSISLGAGSILKNVSGNIVVGGEGGLTGLNLVLNDSNVGLNGRGDNAKIEQGTGSLIINEPTTVELNIDAIVDILTAQQNENSYLTLTSGTLVCDDYANIRFNQLLSNYGIRVTGVDGANGSLVLSGNATGLYKVTGEAGSDPDVIDNYNTLGMYAGVVLQRNQTLTANLAGAPAAGSGGMLVNNLMGASGSSFVVNNTAPGAGNAVVILNNEQKTTGEDPAVVGADTEIAGNIVGNDGVTFVKQGDGTLTVGGTLTTDTLRMEEGGLTLSGNGSQIDHVELSGTQADALPELKINGNTDVGSLTDDVADGQGGTVTLGNGATLTLGEDSSLTRSAIGGTGTLALENTLALSGTAKIDGDLIVNLVRDDPAKAAGTGGMLDLGATSSNHIGGLAGNGTLRGNNGALSIEKDHDSVFSGTFEGSGTLTIADGASQTLQDASTAGGSNWNIVNNGTLSIRTGGTLGNAKANTNLALGSLTLNSGSTTHITVNTDFAGPLVTLTGTLSIQDGAHITLSSTGNQELVANDDGSYTLMMAEGAIDLNGQAQVEITLDPTSPAFKKFASKAYLRDDGNGHLILVAEASGDNKYALVASSFNSRAGAELLWNLPTNLAEGSVLREVDKSVASLLEKSPGEATRVMAAVAGSTVTSLGMAQKDALRDQMGMIRNRLTDMGVDQTLVNEDMPYFHMWAQATGNHATLNESGDESGYTLDTWGGTVGVDADLTDYTTVGAAFTAAYGDIDATAAETATGDFDSYYVNVFARTQVNRWTHKLIATVGINDAKLTRTVDYGAGSYKARGTTNGTGWGAMYELTYDTYLNEDRTAVLQPLLNVSIQRTQMDAYSEDGGTAGDAGLNVGEQEMTVGTVALGMRVAGQLSENMLGRASFGEFRVNLAQDMGDARSEASVGFIGAPGMRQTVRGAREGRTAVQIGAGLTVPIAEQSSIYFDVNADFRSHASSVNGSVGYRYDF